MSCPSPSRNKFPPGKLLALLFLAAALLAVALARSETFDFFWEPLDPSTNAVAGYTVFASTNAAATNDYWLAETALEAGNATNLTAVTFTNAGTYYFFCAAYDVLDRYGPISDVVTLQLAGDAQVQVIFSSLWLPSIAPSTWLQATETPPGLAPLNLDPLPLDLHLGP